MDERIVVTGMGAVTAVGGTAEETWDSLVSGRSGVRNISIFDASRLSVRFAAEVSDWKPEDYMPRKDARRMDRYSQFASSLRKRPQPTPDSTPGSTAPTESVS